MASRLPGIWRPCSARVQPDAVIPKPATPPRFSPGRICQYPPISARNSKPFSIPSSRSRTESRYSDPSHTKVREHRDPDHARRYPQPVQASHHGHRGEHDGNLQRPGRVFVTVIGVVALVFLMQRFSRDCFMPPPPAGSSRIRSRSERAMRGRVRRTALTPVFPFFRLYQK